MGDEKRPLLRGAGIVVRKGRRTILDDVDIAVEPEQILTLIGPNGSGKTTLIRTLLGLQRPDKGRIDSAPGLRVGYMPQRLRVDRTLPISVRRFLELSGERDPAALSKALEQVGAPEVMEHEIRLLSGGELHRVLLARALLRRPDLLVLDEPTANVDVRGQTEIHELIRSVRDSRRCGVLMVSHDLHLVMAATDRVLCLNGHVCCSGVPEDVSQHPAYLALLGDRPATIAVYSHSHDHRHA